MRVVLTACLLLSALGAMPAHAVIITDSFSGTISSGTDSAGYFGGGSMAGKTTSGTITFDTSLLSYNVLSYYDYYIGGGGSSFLLNLTVNGAAVSQVVSFGEIVAQAAGADTEFTIAGFSGSGPGITFSFDAIGPWAPGVINQPFVLDPSAAQSIYVGSDSFSMTAAASGGSAPVPEPASAFLLSAGLAALGVARRRKTM
jgi:hypothetical protein